MNTKRTTRGDALVLTGAAVVKALVQLLTPIALVRLLTQTEFGEFRLFWLVANTATLILPLGMSRSLLYFLPKSTAEERGLYVSQTYAYFLGIGLLAALVFVLGNWETSSLSDPEWVMPVFLFFWVASSSPVQHVPNADQNVVWQASAIIAIALLRAVTVLLPALIYRDIQVVFLGLLVWAALQFVILSYYIYTRHGPNLRWPTYTGLVQQVSFAAPFGLSQTLSGARRNVAQWLVVLLFSPAALAVFAIGTSFNAALKLVRGSLGNVLLPKISKSHAAGDTARAVRLNNRGNVAVAAIVTPIICWLWLFAEPVITLMYTADYIGAVPVLRVYLVMLLVMGIELGSVLMVLEQGRFVFLVSLATLFGSTLLSYVGGQTLGLYGIALGGLAGEVFGRAFNFTHASRQLGMRLRDMQDWSTLTRIFCAGFAAILSAYVFGEWLSVQQPVAAIAAGSIVFAASYLVLFWILGVGWLAQALLGRADWR